MSAVVGKAWENERGGRRERAGEWGKAWESRAAAPLSRFSQQE